MDEFRPKLCPLNSVDMTSAMKCLELFLPCTVKPEEADISYKLWFEEFMNLWTVCHDACAWENVRFPFQIFMNCFLLKLTNFNRISLLPNSLNYDLLVAVYDVDNVLTSQISYGLDRLDTIHSNNVCSLSKKFSVTSWFQAETIRKTTQN